MPAKFDKEFKINVVRLVKAVRLVKEEGLPIRKVCRDLGIGGERVAIRIEK